MKSFDPPYNDLMENNASKNAAAEDWPDKPVIMYLSTDLIVVLTMPSDSSVIGEGGHCKLLINVPGSDEPRDPDSDISKILDGLDGLSEASRKLLAQNKRFDFNAGYDCGDEPWAFSHTLSNRTLTRLAAYGATFGITLYPFRPWPTAANP